MSLDILVMAVLVLAALPLGLGLANLAFYRPLPPAGGGAVALSLLVPARNEAARIVPVIEAALASRDVEFEIVVADDSSTDATPEIVREYAARDARVRLVATPPLPQGWGGKNNACFALFKQARHDVLVFLDADVRLAPDALARMAGHMARHPDLALATGFPRQVTVGFWEKLVIPLIHVLLIGYLPFVGERFTRRPMFGAGCGMLMIARRQAYATTGGHCAIRASRHDGVTLPRLFRSHGFATRLFDATPLATTRMYDRLGDLWQGFMKNAHEAMATWTALPVWTVLLAGGHVAPFALAAALWAGGSEAALMRDALIACACSVGFRALLAWRFSQSWLGVVLHPFSVVFLLVLQWVALMRRTLGLTVSWRGRAYETSGTGTDA
jgi:hypothetical protein